MEHLGSVCYFCCFLVPFLFPRFAQDPFGPFATILFASRGDCGASGSVQATGFGAFSRLVHFSLARGRFTHLAGAQRWDLGSAQAAMSMAKEVPRG